MAESGLTPGEVTRRLLDDRCFEFLPADTPDDSRWDGAGVAWSETMERSWPLGSSLAVALAAAWIEP